MDSKFILFCENYKMLNIIFLICIIYCSYNILNHEIEFINDNVLSQNFIYFVFNYLYILTSLVFLGKFLLSTEAQLFKFLKIFLIQVICLIHIIMYTLVFRYCYCMFLKLNLICTLLRNFLTVCMSLGIIFGHLFSNFSFSLGFLNKTHFMYCFFDHLSIWITT